MVGSGSDHAKKYQISVRIHNTVYQLKQYWLNAYGIGR